MDFKSIGDSETFKSDVIQDVATAAKIDAKHVKVTALRAGSVIVDMLIAKEAGDAHKIVRDLLEQVKSPNSLLMQGKLTSKTKRAPASVTDLEARYGEAVNKMQKEMQQLLQLNEKLEEQLKEAAAKQPKAMHASASAANVEASRR
eukprot:08651_1